MDLHAADLIRHADINLAIEAAESAESRIDAVGTVRGADDNNLTTALDTVHEGEQLRDNTLLDLALGLLTVGRDGVDLIDKDNGGLVRLRLGEGLSQILFGLTGHL